MMLKYTWRPVWGFDETDKRYFPRDWQRALVYSNDNGESWQDIPTEPFPDEVEQQKRWESTKPKK